LNYKCIIFDCDGVLVDSEPIANKMLIDMADELGVAISMDFAIDHFVGKSLYTCMKVIEDLGSFKLPTTFEKEFRRRSFDRFERELQPIPGIVGLVSSLEIPFCVASSGPLNKIELNLQLTGLFDYFKGKLFSCYQVQKWKPAPDVFLLAAKTMGFEPKDCLVIEDSIAGITGAKNGGFSVIAYENDFNKKLIQSVGVPKITAMKDVLTHLKPTS
tara:strand:- start:96202 stop:96846 length:645 start_codon:yes stop_codon:yes gene_type:complete